MLFIMQRGLGHRGCRHIPHLSFVRYGPLAARGQNRWAESAGFQLTDASTSTSRDAHSGVAAGSLGSEALYLRHSSCQSVPFLSVCGFSVP